MYWFGSSDGLGPDSTG